jgi:hypothetical protein
MGFVTAAPENFHKSMDKAFALMLRCSVAELWIQSSQDLMEGMEALACVLSFTLGAWWGRTSASAVSHSARRGQSCVSGPHGTQILRDGTSQDSTRILKAALSH